jgi:hypothetical protein
MMRNGAGGRAGKAGKHVEVMVRVSREVIDRLDNLNQKAPNLTRAAIVRALVDAGLPLAEKDPAILLGPVPVSKSA